MATVSAEEILYSLLTNESDVTDLTGLRIYPNLLPQGCAMPAITYQRISGHREHCLGGPSGRARPRFQIDCWAADYDGAKDLANKVRLCLDGFKGDINTESDVGGITLEADRDIWEDDINVYRISMDFIIPHFETT